MNDGLNRREWLRKLTATGVAAGLGGYAARGATAQDPGESSGFQQSIINPNEVVADRASPSVKDGMVIQPESEMLKPRRPVFLRKVG